MYHSRLTSALAMAALAAILVPSSLPAQITFERTYGDTAYAEGYSVQQTADGGYIIAGFFYGNEPQSYDIYFIRTDAAGDTLWTGLEGGDGIDYGNSALQTSDGGFVIAGTRMDQGSSDNVCLIKTDSSGHILWTRAYGDTGSQYGESAQQTCDGGFIIAGSIFPYGSDDGDVYLIKTDANGDTLWTRKYGGAAKDVGLSVQQTADSGYVTAGWTESFGAGATDFYLIKTNAAGDTLWTRTYGGASEDLGNSVQQTADGGYVIAGYTASFGAGRWDIYLIKTDAAGDTMWTRTFGTTGPDYGYSVRQTTDGGYVVTGQVHDSLTEEGKASIVKTDSNGGTLWTMLLCPAGYVDAEGHSVVQTADGGYAILGYAYGYPGHGTDVFLAKTDPDGNVAVAEPKASSTRAPALSLACTPNPASGSVTISLSPSIPLSLSPVLRIYDSQGRRVRTFTVNRTPCTVWDGTDELGRALPSGTYFIVLNVSGQHATTRIVLQH